MLYYSKAIVSAILAVFQLVWNVANVYYENFWTTKNCHYGFFSTFAFFALVPTDLYMGTVRDIVFMMVQVYNHRDLYARAAIVLCFTLCFLDIVVYLKVRAESEISKQLRKVEDELRELIAYTEGCKSEKESSDRYADNLSIDHRTLLSSYYDLQGEFAEMKDRATVAELRLAEDRGLQEELQKDIRELKNEVARAEKAAETSKTRALTWKKMAIDGHISWRQWSKDGASAKIENGQLKAKVTELEVKGEKLKAITANANAVARKLRAEEREKAADVRYWKKIANEAEGKFVPENVDLKKEIQRLKRDLAIEQKELVRADAYIENLMTQLDNVTSELDRADEWIIKVTNKLETELEQMTKERDDYMDVVGAQAVELF